MRRAALPWLCLSAAVAAHEGHSENTAPAVAAAVVLAEQSPKLVLGNARIELVAALEGREWVIYVDDARSNAPLRGLNLQLQQGQRQLQAAEGGDDRYHVPADLLEAGAAIRFTVRAADWVSELDGLLPQATVAAAPAPRDASGRGPLLLVSLALLTSLAAAWWAYRQRQRQ